jgi:hypothetical protein
MSYAMTVADRGRPSVSASCSSSSLVSCSSLSCSSVRRSRGTVGWEWADAWVARRHRTYMTRAISMEFVGSLIVLQHTGIGEGAAPNSALRCRINYGALTQPSSSSSLHV